MKDKLKKSKIFLAGHNGMVGSSLYRFLKKKNFKNIITVSRNKLNLNDQIKVDKFIKEKKPNIIINCAGKVGGIWANSHYPVEFLDENILIQMNLIKSAYKNKIKHLINLGSSCIYPKNSKQPIKEEYLLSGQLEKTNEAYALAKIVGLKACEYYNKQYGTSYLTVMPCNLYGPNDNFDLKNSHFIPALIKKFVQSKKNKKKEVEIWGSGSPKREIMYVDDIASAIFFIIKKKISKDKFLINYLKKESVINVGSDTEYTIKKIAQIISKTINNKSKLRFNRKYPDGTPRKILNNKVIKKLGWKPKVSLTEGLNKTLEWYYKNFN
ncbi:GDP-L-fucose synthase [Pelagibacteraceae bacterium]|nr:GDP-L-fucose synthase [Candidatus Pelagibacter sp.]MDC1485742.1 GDP-L-fucose synthase [Pelagibacteraceae bacterium]